MKSMSGLTWRAMVRAAESDPAIAARVRHFSQRVPFEFYDYKEDTDALQNLIDDPALQDTIQQYRVGLADMMRSTNDGQYGNYQRAIRAAR